MGKFRDYTDEELLGKVVILYGCRLDGKTMFGKISRVKKRFFEVTVKIKDSSDWIYKFNRDDGYCYPYEKWSVQYCRLKGE